MKTMLTILMIAASFSQILAAPFRFDLPGSVQRSVDEPSKKDDPETPFCRLFQGPSRCVDEPLPVVDKEPWCPYRFCGPSYVEAELCPSSIELQATNKCIETEITRDIYRCDGKHFGHNFVPIGCEEGTPGCIETPTCSCYKAPLVTSKILKEVAPFKPDCSQRAP